MLTMLMVCCEVGPRQASAGQRVAPHDYKYDTGDVLMDIVNKNDMEFHVYHNYHGVFVVNQTKELLEVELLKKQINEINKRNQE